MHHNAPPYHKISTLLLTVLLPFALAHFISYVYRTINAVVYPELAQDLNLGADSLGLMTSSYLLAFAIAQFPVGVTLDRFGPRKTQIPLLMIAAAGGLFFSQAQSLNELILARGLIGFGVAGSLMAAIKACSLWLPPVRLPLATAVVLSVGGLGAMTSTTPAQIALEYTDWRHLFIILSAGTALIGLTIFTVVPEHPHKQNVQLGIMAQAVRQLYTSWSFWRLALYTLLPHATYMAIQGLWMGPWLHDVARLTRAEVANTLFFSTVAMVTGSLVFGWLTDYLRRFNIRPILVCGTGIGLFLFFQLLMICNVSLSPIILAVGFSFFGTASTMNYAILAQSMPGHLTGRVSTSFNLLIFLFGFCIQWGLGGLIGFWERGQNGAYPTTAYSIAFGLILLLQIPGFLLWISFKPWQKENGDTP